MRRKHILIGALAVASLLALRQTNCVPFRFRQESPSGWVETANDLFGSYYRPIISEEGIRTDVGKGVRYRNFEDAVDRLDYAWNNDEYDKPRPAQAYIPEEVAEALADLAEKQSANVQPTPTPEATPIQIPAVRVDAPRTAEINRRLRELDAATPAP